MGEYRITIPLTMVETEGFPGGGRAPGMPPPRWVPGQRGHAKPVGGRPPPPVGRDGDTVFPHALWSRRGCLLRREAPHPQPASEFMSVTCIAKAALLGRAHACPTQWEAPQHDSNDIELTGCCRSPPR